MFRLSLKCPSCADALSLWAKSSFLDGSCGPGTQAMPGEEQPRHAGHPILRHQTSFFKEKNLKSYLKSYYQNIFASKPEEKDALPRQLGWLSSTEANPEQRKYMDQQHGENKQTTKPQTNKHPKNDKKGPFCRPCNTKAQAKRAK